MATIRRLGRCRCGYSKQATKADEAELCPRCSSTLSWGSYIARVTRDGVTHTKSFPKRKDCETWLSMVNVATRQKLAMPAPPADLNWRDAITLFRKSLDADGKLRQSTKDFYCGRLTALTGHFGKYTLLSISTGTLKEFIQARRAIGVSDTTIKHDLVTLTKIYKTVYLDDAGKWTHLLIKLSEIKMIMADAKFVQMSDGISKALTVEQLKRILAAVDKLRDNPERMRAILYTAMLTGLRKQNVLGLQWKYIKENTIEIPAAEMKNKKPCVLPLPEQLKSILEAYRRSQGIIQPAVFGNAVSIRTQWENLVKLAGLPSVTFHQLRHSYASIALSNGVDLATISELLHHSSIAITKTIYAHNSQERKAVVSGEIVRAMGL